MWLIQLYTRYRERYNKDFDPQKYRKSSFFEVIHDLTPELQITLRRPPNQGYWLTDAKNPVPIPPRPIPIVPEPEILDPCPENREQVNDALPIEPYREGVLKDDEAQLNEFILSLPVSEFGTGDEFTAIITEVYSPSHLWVQISDINNSGAVKELEVEMTRYFNEEGRNRYLHESVFHIGHYCAVLVDNMWQRAVIVASLCLNVKVLLVDYGITKLVEKYSLRPLLRVWMDLPRQAYRARLFGLKPLQRAVTWQREVCRELREIVYDSIAIVTVIRVDNSEKVLEVDICHPEHFRSINDYLVELGLALYLPASARQKEACLFPYSSPDFDILEASFTPSYTEIEELLTENKDLLKVRSYTIFVNKSPVLWIVHDQDIDDDDDFNLKELFSECENKDSKSKEETAAAALMADYPPDTVISPLRSPSVQSTGFLYNIPEEENNHENIQPPNLTHNSVQETSQHSAKGTGKFKVVVLPNKCFYILMPSFVSSDDLINTDVETNIKSVFLDPAIITASFHCSLEKKPRVLPTDENPSHYKQNINPVLQNGVRTKLKDFMNSMKSTKARKTMKATNIIKKKKNECTNITKKKNEIGSVSKIKVGDAEVVGGKSSKPKDNNKVVNKGGARLFAAAITSITK